MRVPSTALLLLLLREPSSHAFLVGTPRVISSTRLAQLQQWNGFASTTTPLKSASTSQQEIEDDNVVPSLFQGRTTSSVWRPDKQDVERISWGKPAKKKGTGSRGVPHRLNQEERFLFDQARVKGFLEVMGSAWRAERRGAPLLNTYRSWCDACAHASIVLHKGNTGHDDAVVVDISPLRLAATTEFERVAKVCLQQQDDGSLQAQGGVAASEEIIYAEIDTEKETDAAALLLDDDDDNAWETQPIYRLPPYCIVWEDLPRNDAKALARKMANLCQTPEANSKGRRRQQKASKKPRGVKPGKNRRHGGYGIG